MSEEHDRLHDDEGCVLHGTKSAPLPVDEKRHDALQYIGWEYRKIEQTIGRATRLHQSVVEHEGRLMDRILMQIPGGENHVFYFDVNEQLASTVQASMDTEPGKTFQVGVKNGPRRRFVVVWGPTYDDGAARYSTIQLLRAGWAARMPELLERRVIETADTSHPEILRKCGEWLQRTWSRPLPQKRVSVLLVSDADWETHPEKWRQSAELMNSGFSYFGREKPMFMATCIESDGTI